jgi:hypothetical protein
VGLAAAERLIKEQAGERGTLDREGVSG